MEKGSEPKPGGKRFKRRCRRKATPHGYMLWNSRVIAVDVLKPLLDRELPLKGRQRIRDAVMACPDVRGVHDLRTGYSDDRTFGEFHLEVDFHLTIAQGHAISDAVKAALARLLPSIVEVTAHLEPPQVSTTSGSTTAWPRCDIAFSGISGLAIRSPAVAAAGTPVPSGRLRRLETGRGSASRQPSRARLRYDGLSVRELAREATNIIILARRQSPTCVNSPSSASASFRPGVPSPSVNQP
jgi:hypothetical protein